MTNRWIVAWDFVQPAKRTFYKILNDEFGPLEAERVQRSVLICKDDFVARRLCALARIYGANVVSHAITDQSLDDVESDRDAEAFVERIQAQRLSRRGRRRAK